MKLERLKVGDHWFVPETPDTEEVTGQHPNTRISVGGLTGANKEFYQDLVDTGLRDRNLPYPPYLKRGLETYSEPGVPWDGKSFKLPDMVAAAEFLQVVNAYIKERDEFKKFLTEDGMKCYEAQTAYKRLQIEKEAAIKHLEDKINKIKLSVFDTIGE